MNKGLSLQLKNEVKFYFSPFSDKWDESSYQTFATQEKYVLFFNATEFKCLLSMFDLLMKV